MTTTWQASPAGSDEPQNDLYTAAERGIFGPFDPGDGSKVYADPIRVERRLRAGLDGDPARAIGLAIGGFGPISEQAMERVLPAAVYALELLAFDRATGKGMREDAVIALLNEYLDWIEAQKNGQELSDMAAAYGGILGNQRPEYRLWVQLWLNLPRQQLRQAAALVRGFALAQSVADLPAAYARAVADTPAEAAEVLFKTNAGRKMARAQRDRKRR